jgi:hypothetical protein
MSIGAQHKKTRKDGRRFNPHSAKSLNKLTKEVKALELRLEGKTFQQIGAAIGMSDVGAKYVIERILMRNEGDLKQKAEEARQEELERLRKLLTFMWEGAKTGNPKSAQVVLQISQRVSRLKGLDAPVTVQGTGEGGAITIEVARRLMAEDEAEANKKENVE